MNKPHCKRLRQHWNLLSYTRARVAELADALRSGRSDRKVVEVRVLSRAPISPHERNLSRSAGKKQSLTVSSRAGREPRVVLYLPLALLQEEEYAPCRSNR